MNRRGFGARSGLARAVRLTFAIVLPAVMLAATVLASAPPAHAAATPFAVQEARLHAVGGGDRDLFGSAVAIDGDTLVVGSPDWDSVAGSTNAGAAYVYVRSGTSWSLQAVLHAPTYAAGDKFGTSVAISGNRIVVGAPYRLTAKGQTGAAYVFTRTGTTWSLPVTLPTELANDGDRIGWSVDIDGTDIVIGCPGDGNDPDIGYTSGRGAVRPIFWNGSSWDSGGGIQLTDTFDGTQPGDHLGSSVAISGDKIIASEPGEDQSGITDCGAFLVWVRGADNWTLIQQQYAPVRVAGESFGGPIDISTSGYSAIIGSANYGDNNLGRAYIYTDPFLEGEFGHSATLANPGPNSPDGDWFGSSVALDGDTLALVGAFWDDSHIGAAYYFEYSEGSWSMRQKADATAEDPGVALFGSAVAMSDGTAVVGAELASAGTPDLLPGGAFVYNSRGIITGIVRDAITLLPIPGAEMSAYVLDMFGEPQLARGDSLTFTDGTGRYTLSVDTGSYPVGWMGVVYPAGFYDGVRLWRDATPVAVAAGATTNLDLYLSMQFTAAVEEDDKGAHFGRMIHVQNAAYSGGGYLYGYSKAPYTGTYFETTFSGSKVRWIGPKQPAYGMAKVYIDGVYKATVDCYAAPGDAELSAVLWESAVLTDGPHTIKIEMGSTKNPASSNYIVVIDKIEYDGVTTTPPQGDRINETAGTFLGGWVKNLPSTAYTYNTYAYSYWAGARFVKNFYGTRVAWIGPKVYNYGRAAVYIDGVYKGTVSQYAPGASIWFRARVWESAVLPAGNHTFEIRVLGTKDAASTGTFIVVDSIDVTP
jgi:hypothetical protein